MIQRLRSFLQKKKTFSNLCTRNNLSLDYPSNQDETLILKAIFEEREYANYFPFYQQATVVDIGAHCGYFSLFAKNNLDKEARIFAFEPNSRNYHTLSQNLADNHCTNVQAYHAAIGSENGTMKLYKGNSPNHSLVANYALSAAEAAFEEVSVMTLEKLISDNKIEKIDFLKMDCEGAEYDIIANSPDAVFHKIQTISMEFHDLKDKNKTGEWIVTTLASKGFEIVRYHYDHTSQNLNYGKIIATKIFDKK